MNRKIEYRGICIDDEIWKYGYLVKNGDRCFIFTGELETNKGLYPTWERSEVLPDTIGQLMPLPHNIIKIYEGDVLKDEYNRILLVEWWKCSFALKALSETNFIRAYNPMEWFEGDTPEPKIIGNIIQNPELRSLTPQR